MHVSAREITYVMCLFKIHRQKRLSGLGTCRMLLVMQYHMDLEHKLELHIKHIACYDNVAHGL